eukprot:jgi/Ulvmu1/751/UM010_0125.1
MGMKAVQLATCVSLCLSATAAHVESGLETVILRRAFAQFEPEVLGPATQYGADPFSAHGKRDPFKDDMPMFPQTVDPPGPETGRKLLLDQVTTSVIESSPENSTLVTREIEKLCPKIRTGPALCETGPWAIRGEATMTYNLTIPASDVPLALQVTLQPTAGDADVYIFLVEEFGPATLRAASILVAGHDVTSIDSHFLPPGQEVAIQVRAVATRADYYLTVDLFEEGRKVSDRDAKALAAISAACCADGSCTANTFTQYATDPTAFNPCEVPGWFCNSDGHITHMILQNFGLKCLAVDLAPLAQMKDLHAFSIDTAPGLTGDINTFLAHFKDDHALQVLEVLSTGMTGMLPEKCAETHQFQQLVRLALDDMKISGHISDCLLEVEALTIARTNVHEALPAIPANSTMRRLTLVQVNDNKPRIRGDAATFEQLTSLQSLTLTYTDFRGHLKAGPALRVLLTIGLPFTKFSAASQNRLVEATMVDGKLAGKVPTELLNDSDMQQLLLRNNSLTSIDQTFGSTLLRILDLSYNAIEGPLPPSLGTQPSLLFLTVAHNQFSGPIDAFSRAIKEGNIVHYFDVAGNALTGPLIGLEVLAVISKVDALLVHPEAKVPLPNVLNASLNNFEGTLPIEYYAAASAGGPDRLPLVLIDIRGNKLLDCPEPADVSTMVQIVCDTDTADGISITDEDMTVVTPNSLRSAPAPADSGGTGLAAGAIAGVVIAVVAAVVIAAVIVAAVLRRYKQQKQDAWTDAAYREEGTTAATL